MLALQVQAEEYRIDIGPSEYIVYSNDKITLDASCVKNSFKDFPIKLKAKDGISIKEFLVDNKNTKINRIINDRNSIYYIHNGIAYIKNPELKTKEILISHGIYKGDKLNQKWNLWSYSFDSQSIKECIKKAEVKKEEPIKPEKLKNENIKVEPQKQKVVKNHDEKKQVDKPIVKEVGVENKQPLSSKTEEIKVLPIIKNEESKIVVGNGKNSSNAPAIKNDAVKIFNNKKQTQEIENKDVEAKQAQKEKLEIVKILGADSSKKEVTPIVKDKDIAPKEEKKAKHANNVANKIKLPQNMRYCVLEETEKLVYQKFPNYEMTEFEKDPKFQEHMDESIIKALEICSKKK